MCELIEFMKIPVFRIIRRLVDYKFTDVSEVVAVIAFLIKAAGTSEMSVNIYEAARYNNPESSHLRTPPWESQSH